MAVIKTHWPVSKRKQEQPKKEVLVEEKKAEEIIEEEGLLVEEPTVDEIIASLPKKPKNKKYKIVE